LGRELPLIMPRINTKEFICQVSNTVAGCQKRNIRPSFYVAYKLRRTSSVPDLQMWRPSSIQIWPFLPCFTFRCLAVPFYACSDEQLLGKCPNEHEKLFFFLQKCGVPEFVGALIGRTVWTLLLNSALIEHLYASAIFSLLWNLLPVRLEYKLSGRVQLASD